MLFGFREGQSGAGDVGPQEISKGPFAELPDDSGERQAQIELPDDSGEKVSPGELPDDSGEKPFQAKQLDESQRQDLEDEQDTGSSKIVDVDSEKPVWMAENVESSERPSPQDSEKKALECYGGDAQRSYKNGEEVPYGTPGSTRPDIVRETDNGQLEAIEVKNYDLKKDSQQLVREIARQVLDRVQNMPAGTKQRVCLDVRGQNLSDEEIDKVKMQILEATNEFCSDLSIDVMRDEG